MSAKFWFCVDDIICCVKGSEKKWMLDWPNILIVWLVKVGGKLSWEEVFALKDDGFQL